MQSTRHINEIEGMTELLNKISTDIEVVKKGLSELLDNILEEACKTRDLTKFNLFREKLNRNIDNSYGAVSYRTELNFSVIIMQKAAQKLSFADFSSLYPILQKECEKDSAYAIQCYQIDRHAHRKRKAPPSLENVMESLDLKNFSHVENLLLMISPTQFVKKCMVDNSVQGFLDCMKAIKIVSAATNLATSGVMRKEALPSAKAYNAQAIVKAFFGNIILNNLTPETKYNNVSKFLTSANRELHGEVKEDPSTLHPFLLQHCQAVSEHPIGIAALIPEDKNKENATTQLFLKEVVKIVKPANFLAVYKHLLGASHPRSLSYFYDMLLGNEVFFNYITNRSHAYYNFVFSKSSHFADRPHLLSYVLQNIDRDGYREKLFCLLENACPTDNLVEILKNPDYLNVLTHPNQLGSFKKLIQGIKRDRQPHILSDILFSLYEIQDFKKLILIKNTFPLDADKMLEICIKSSNPLKVFLDLVKEFQKENSGVVDPQFILSFIEKGVVQLSTIIKLMSEKIDSQLLCQFLKVANENLCANEKNKKGEEKEGEEKDVPYCHQSIKNLLGMIKRDIPNLLEKLIGENIAQNKEISEILREVFFANDKYFLEFYEKMDVKKIPAFFVMLSDNIRESIKFTEEQQKKLDRMILQGQPSFLTYLLENKSDPEVLKIVFFRKLSSSALEKFIFEDQRFLSIVDCFGIRATLDCLVQVVDASVMGKVLQHISNTIFDTNDTDKIFDLMDILSDMGLESPNQFLVRNIIKIVQLPSDKFDKFFGKKSGEALFEENDIRENRLQAALADALLSEDFKVMQKIPVSRLKQIWTPEQLIAGLTTYPKLFWSYVDIFNSTEYRDALIKKGLPCVITFLSLDKGGLKDFLDQTRSFCNRDNVFRNAESKEDKDEFATSICLKTLKDYVVSPKNNDPKYIIAAIQAIYLLETRPANMKNELTALRDSLQGTNKSLHSHEVIACLGNYFQQTQKLQQKNTQQCLLRTIAS